MNRPVFEDVELSEWRWLAYLLWQSKKEAFDRGETFEAVVNRFIIQLSPPKGYEARSYTGTEFELRASCKVFEGATPTIRLCIYQSVAVLDETEFYNKLQEVLKLKW